VSLCVSSFVYKSISKVQLIPVPVAARWKVWVCGCSTAGIVGSNLAGDGIVCCECSLLSVRGHCDVSITRPEEFYRIWCAVLCDMETSRMRRF